MSISIHKSLRQRAGTFCPPYLKQNLSRSQFTLTNKGLSDVCRKITGFPGSLPPDTQRGSSPSVHVKGKIQTVNGLLAVRWTRSLSMANFPGSSTLATQRVCSIFTMEISGHDTRINTGNNIIHAFFSVPFTLNSLVTAVTPC